jgi:hypothetical protein
MVGKPIVQDLGGGMMAEITVEEAAFFVVLWLIEISTVNKWSCDYVYCLFFR